MRRKAPPRDRQDDQVPPAAMWKLLKLCAADPHCWKFIRSIQQNAERIVDDHHAHSGMIVFNPPWLFEVSLEVLRALRPTK